MQYREHSGISIDVDLNNSFGAFAKINSNELKRVISNLVNNSVEAFKMKQGNVVIGVRKHRDNLEIFVRDNGHGIPEDILKKIGQYGLSHGKNSQDLDQGNSKSGNGIGIYHAKQTIESFSGELIIESEVAKGTTVRMRIPQAQTPIWFTEQIDLTDIRQIVSLDDDVTIHQIWSGRLSSLGFGHIEHHKIQSGEVFRNFVISNLNDLSSTLFLVDFELLNQPKTGLDIIEELGIEKQSLLVTSRYEETSIQARAETIGLKLLPKSLAASVPITMKSPKEKYDLVLVDDDTLIHAVWNMEAKRTGKKLKVFSSGFQLKAALEGLDKSNSFYIDSNLENGEKGEVLAKEIFDKGFENLFLVTGYDPSEFKHLAWLKGIAGKEFPK